MKISDYIAVYQYAEHLGLITKKDIINTKILNKQYQNQLKNIVINNFIKEANNFKNSKKNK